MCSLACGAIGPRTGPVHGCTQMFQWDQTASSSSHPVVLSHAPLSPPASCSGDAAERRRRSGQRATSRRVRVQGCASEARPHKEPSGAAWRGRARTRPRAARSGWAWGRGWAGPQERHAVRACGNARSPSSSHTLPRASAKETKTMDRIGLFLSREMACQLQYFREKGWRDSSHPNTQIYFLSSIFYSYKFHMLFLPSKHTLTVITELPSGMVTDSEYYCPHSAASCEHPLLIR